MSQSIDSRSPIRSALVVDDHPFVAQGTAQYLMTHCAFDRVDTVANAAECLAWLQTQPLPQLAVIDFWLIEGTALDLLGRLARDHPCLPVLVLSGDDNATVRRQVAQAGALGIVGKNRSPEEFAHAVAAVGDGDSWFDSASDPAHSACAGVARELPVTPKELGLTLRQAEVLSHVMCGLPNKRIARELNLSEPTVKEHITHILGRLGVTSRMQAMSLLRGKRVAL